MKTTYNKTWREFQHILDSFNPIELLTCSFASSAFPFDCAS